MPQVTDETPSVAGETKPAPTYWRSLNELENTPEFNEYLKREFPGIKADELSENSRRRFLQLMGASIALATVTGCWKEDKIIPAVKGDSAFVPGTSKHFATAMEIGGVAQSLLVTSYDGRPVKVEGNPAHPESLGACNLFAQASTLELYDPDRSTQIHKKGEKGLIPATLQEYTAFAKTHFADLKAKGGAGLRVLSDATSSVTMAALKAKFATAFPQAKWFEYEPVSSDNEREGTKIAFGQALRPILSLKSAKVILALDSDFLNQHPSSLRLGREFAAGRKPGAGMSRLYSVESVFSSTGASADHRLPMRATEIGSFLAAVAAELAKDAKFTSSPAAKLAAGVKAEGEWSAEDKKVLGALVKDLSANAGASLIVVGPRQPAEVHALANALNVLLGNVGKTVSFVADPDAARPSYVESLKALVATPEAEINTLVILGGNPSYDAPADLKFAEKLAKIPNVIQHSVYFNETSTSATWHLPRTHYMEAWGDARTWDGTHSIVQPLILPLYNAKSSLELVSEIIGEPRKGYDLVRNTLKETVKEGFEAAWRTAVHNGLVAGSAYPTVTPTLKAEALTIETKAPAKGEIELVFTTDTKIYDGRFANNGWLQETSDFLTKLTWDNALMMAPETAKRLNLSVKLGAVVNLAVNGASLDVAVYTMPGHPKDSVSLALGYGRTVCGNVGGYYEKRIAAPGVNAYALRTSTAKDVVASGVKLTVTTKEYKLATTQDHWAIDTTGQKGIAERIGELVREAPLDAYEKDKNVTKGRVHLPEHMFTDGNIQKGKQLFNEWKYEGNKWGLAIDLNACTGCMSCLVACQSENNIPIVGKDQVLRGREMHWLRLDRYFKGDVNNPEIAQQPVMCQQCENAPCEQVCPVAATVHSSEGLNEMVYNRCIGTRYCSNNCPYKVRRFNFFDWNKTVKNSKNDVQKMVFNPEVTVRMRGVMEKCTFCVQRIQVAKIKHKNAGERTKDDRTLIPDGTIKSACQQACPAEAIVFGDLNDKESRVSKQFEDSRSYFMLAELNVRPRVSYMAKIRNPHPDLIVKSEEKNEHAHGAAH